MTDNISNQMQEAQVELEKLPETELSGTQPIEMPLVEVEKKEAEVVKTEFEQTSAEVGDEAEVVN